MLRTFLSVAAAALLISVILSTPASSADTGEASIPSGEHKAWPIENDQPFTLTYDIRSGTNTTLNVIVVSSEEYNKYLDGVTYAYIAQASHINATRASANVAMEPGEYYVVVEDERSIANETSSVIVSYNINAVVPSTDGGPLQTILTVGAVAIFGLVLIIFVDVVTKKRR